MKDTRYATNTMSEPRTEPRSEPRAEPQAKPQAVQARSEYGKKRSAALQLSSMEEENLLERRRSALMKEVRLLLELHADSQARFPRDTFTRLFQTSVSIKN